VNVYRRQEAGPRRSTPRRTGRTGRLRDFGEDPDFVPPPLKLDPSTLPWWNVTERVRYLPAVGPTREQVLAALGGWFALLLLVIWLPVDSVPLLVGLWTLVVGGAGAVTRITRRHLASSGVDRAFIAESGDRSTFGLPGAEHDQLAERLTAELLLDYLTRLPGTRVFHGLTCPGSVFADVDHAVLRGHRLVLIESKMWLPGHYSADDAGGLRRNGHSFRGGAVRLPEGLAAYRELLPDVEVRGVLVVYPSRAGEVTTESTARAPTPPMSPDQFVRRIGAWLAAEPAVVDRDVFRTILGRLAKTDL
jgi:hypothetical protein